MLAPRKQVIAISPTSLTNGATATGNFDRRGFNYLEIDVIATTQDVITNTPSVLKLSESDDTIITNFVDIVGTRAGTDFTAGGNTSNPYGYKYTVDLRGRKRFIKVTVSPRTTQTIGVVGNLGRAEDAPVTAARAGVANLITI